MRRVILALLATTVGLVLLLSYKAHTQSPVVSALSAPDPGPSATTDPTSGAANGAILGPAASPTAASTPTSGSGSGTNTSTNTSAKSGTFVGAPVSSQFSTIQVEVVLADGRISDIKLLEDTDDEQRSAMIDGYATPILRSEALSAQSANIDVVSGATYTSQSYSQSLQSALDKAGL
ncbi:MAG TPA: FMN-binding protein [Actinocrinis sp.]|nr:FMN-binding protein [Actinocrinis sp.]